MAAAVNEDLAAWSVDALKLRLVSHSPVDFVDQFLLTDQAKHFSNEQRQMVAARLEEKFRVSIGVEDVCVVGSAKVGFALFQKRPRHTPILPAFRPFSSHSDIDIALTNRDLFEKIWDELSKYANSRPNMPWESGRLGNYLVHGWLRPDHFPHWARLRCCDDLWDTMRTCSADRRLGGRPIRFAVFHSRNHLRHYQVRCVTQCRNNIEAMGK